MTQVNDPEVEPQFSQPVRQMISMLIALGVLGGVIYVGWTVLFGIFATNFYLNGLILAVFVLGVLSCFAQVVQLASSVRWIEGFARGLAGQAAPSLLAPLATLLRSRGARMQLSSSSARSILDSVASRIDEDREITRYLGNTLVFLGLLGTFYGLATTVPALVDTIRNLSPQAGESGADTFGRLQVGLEQQLGGMGTAFSSSLLGLGGSLVVGLLELFAGHGQNRFYRELEEWLSTITRLGFASGEDGSAQDTMMAGVLDHMAEQMEALQVMFTQSDVSRSQVDDRLGILAGAVDRLATRMEADDTSAALRDLAISQRALLAELKDNGGDGIDAESRMRLRSIDVQLLRILEELSAGRQDTVAALRAEITGLGRAVRGGRARPDGNGGT